jgi:hypothetical protein
LTGYLFFIKQELSNYPAHSFNHGYEPQNKRWKLFPAASFGDIQPSAFGGIVPNSLLTIG